MKQFGKYRILWIVLCVISVGLLAITWFVGTAPQINNIKKANAETAEVKENNKKLQNEIDELKKAKQTIGEKEESLKNLQKQVPTDYSQDEFFDMIGSAAASTGVSVKAINFTAPADAKVPSTVSGSITGNLKQIPVTIKAEGTMDQMKNFVDAIQKIDRILVPSDVKYTINSVSGNGSSTTYDSVDITCNIWSLLNSSGN